MASDANYVGANKTLEAYKSLAETPYFSVMKGRDILFSYNGDDRAEAETKLYEQLVSGEENDNRDLLKLRIHPKKEKGFITDKTPSIATIYFRCCPYDRSEHGYRDPYGRMQSNFVPASMQQMIQGLQSEVNALKGQLSQQPAEKYEEDDIERVERIKDVVSGIVDHPLVMALVSKITGLNIAPLPQVRALGNVPTGTPPEQKLEQAIMRLIAIDPELPDDLLRLADIAEKEPKKFSMLLGMLRTM